MNNQFLHQDYHEIGPSNGTKGVSEIILGEDHRLIAIENVGMFTEEIHLRGAPSRERFRGEKQIRPSVSASLDRSIEEYGDVWEELSKY